MVGRPKISRRRMYPASWASHNDGRDRLSLMKLFPCKGKIWTWLPSPRCAVRNSDGDNKTAGGRDGHEHNQRNNMIIARCGTCHSVGCLHTATRHQLRSPVMRGKMSPSSRYFQPRRSLPFLTCRYLLAIRQSRPQSTT